MRLMTIDEMDAMDDDRCDGCDEAIDDTSRFLITQQVMLPFWSWRLHILATFTNLISRQNICTNAWSVWDWSCQDQRTADHPKT
jgi:hypothetical protein